MDLDQLDSRIDSLSAVAENKQYKKQKNSLQRELDSFLASIPGHKNLMSASPKDVVRFLAWKDKGGRTKVHSPQCRFFSLPSHKASSSCGCPTRLAAGTVNSLIGKLRSIFIAAGRGDSWNNILGVGNPAAHPTVKTYLISIQEEQAQARVTPKQAVPIFFDKLQILCNHLRAAAFASDASPVQRYVSARDLAFFCLEFFSADRASDLGRVLTKEVGRLPSGEGLLFNHTFGKTLRGGNANIFMVKTCQDHIVCPVANLDLYVRLCDAMKVNLRDGYLFRTLNSKGEVSDNPFMGSAVANRLTRHLKDVGIHSGETMHSFRSGCSITLSLLGISPEDVASHVGWRTRESFDHYCQINKVLGMDHVASTLASSTSAPSTDAEPAAATVGRKFTSRNSLKDIAQAFL